jgi:ParB-like chromosome segregation protein Spo0J
MINVADYPVEKRALAGIYKSPRALRDVDEENQQFVELAQDIQNRGVIQNIVIRERGPESKIPDGYDSELCDGAQRARGAELAGITELNCIVLPHTVTDDELLIIQMGLNLHRVDTKPAQFARQVKRLILQANEDKDEEKSRISYWANEFAKSEQWVKDRLQISRMEDEIQAHIDKGEIPVANAIMLAKMDPELRSAKVDGQSWTDRASSLDTKDFTSQAADAIKKWKKGQKEEAGTPTLQPRLKPLREVKKFLLAAQSAFEQEKENTDFEALKNDPNFRLGRIYEAKDMLEMICGVDAGSIEDFNRRQEQAKILSEEKKRQRELDKAQQALEDAKNKVREAEKKQQELAGVE